MRRTERKIDTAMDIAREVVASNLHLPRAQKRDTLSKEVYALRV